MKYLIMISMGIVVSLMFIFVVPDMVTNEIINQQQIKNCDILIDMFSNQGYTEEELRSNEPFDFSYYWGLQNDYWQCDKYYDKDEVIKQMNTTKYQRSEQG